MGRKVQYPRYTTGEAVALTDDIWRYPYDAPAHVLVAAGATGEIVGSLFGDCYLIDFGLWSGALAIHAKRNEATNDDRP